MKVNKSKAIKQRYLKISLFMEKLRSLMIYATLKQEMIQDIYGGRRLYK